MPVLQTSMLSACGSAGLSSRWHEPRPDCLVVVRGRERGHWATGRRHKHVRVRVRGRACVCVGCVSRGSADGSRYQEISGSWQEQ